MTRLLEEGALRHGEEVEPLGEETQGRPLALVRVKVRVRVRVRANPRVRVQIRVGDKVRDRVKGRVRV